MVAFADCSLYALLRADDPWCPCFLGGRNVAGIVPPPTSPLTPPPPSPPPCLAYRTNAGILNTCESGVPITDEQTCRQAAGALGKTWRRALSINYGPGGCMEYVGIAQNSGFYLNTHQGSATGTANHFKICQGCLPPQPPPPPSPPPPLPPAPSPPPEAFPLPTGPYFSSVSEVVQLREPSDALDATARTSCPHQLGGLLDWHSVATWPSGALPAAGADVTLPSGRQVLLSRSIGHTLGVLTIPVGTSLVIGEGGATPSPIRLDAAGIIVRGQLQAGSPTCRLLTAVEITLHGTRPATRTARDTLPASSKGIFVDGGTLDLHGKQYLRTWVRLARGVQVGDTVVLVQAPVNWEVGQQIVLVTSALKDARDWHRNEVHTVAAVLSDPASLPAGVGAAVQLQQAAQYAHAANAAYQVEVGLLTRIIKVQGAATDSEPADLSPVACADTQNYNFGAQTVPCAHTHLTGFGAHVLVTGSGAQARIAGVEFFRVGQTNVLGRCLLASRDQTHPGCPAPCYSLLAQPRGVRRSSAFPPAW
jgi:hypothetical protein